MIKKIIVVVLAIFVAISATGCGKSHVWSTSISIGDWVELKTSDGEVIYDGPEEYIDDEYEKKALDESEFNWIWNTDTDEFDKIERGSCVFNS